MKRLYADMDGVVARYHDVSGYLERMWEKGFFLNLKPFRSVVRAINTLAKRKDIEVFILSSCISEQCREEKKEWLKKYLPRIPESHYILVEMGCNKALCVGHPISHEDVLLDDYNKNLEEWQLAGGHAIKLVNNINHKGLIGPLWKGDCCYERKRSWAIVSDLKTMIL